MSYLSGFRYSRNFETEKLPAPPKRFESVGHSYVNQSLADSSNREEDRANEICLSMEEKEGSKHFQVTEL